MKVSVTISMEVDVKAWNAEYGSRETPDQIREAIKAAVGDAANQPFGHLTHAIYGPQDAEGWGSVRHEPIVQITNVR
jgi:hypothetical protein